MARVFKNKECNLCGNLYTPKSPKQKYCILCKDRAAKVSQAKRDKIKNRKKHNIIYSKECPSCKLLFNTYDSKKKYCGSEECEKYRLILKNKQAHEKRDRSYMLEKGREYYKNNIDKARMSTANSYRKKYPSAKPYIPRGKFKNTYEEVKLYIEERGYKLLSTNYINNTSKLVLECPEGHEWLTTFHNFRDNGGVQGNRCATCYYQNNYVSKPEQKIRDFILNSLSDINVEYNNRSIISPQELDLYFPDHNLAIEVCGLYWHGENSSGKNRNYHYNKMINCYEKDIRLITIFEDEINDNFDIVTSRILQALGKPKRRIFARKCTVSILDSKTTNKFYKDNHIQGPSTALERWGLYYEKELVCVGSLGKIGRAHTSSSTTIELKRFCTLPDTSVVGGVGKIFKHMKKYAINNNYTLIKSYCDMRYGNIFKPVYEVLGFELSGFTKYTPHYFKAQKRYRNYSLRKTPEERLTKKTEWELRQDQGYDRIWDCGHRTYVYRLIN